MEAKMKKLITIALLTLSNFSLMAEFPVRADNFHKFQETFDWEQSESSGHKYKTTGFFSAQSMKVNGENELQAYDRKTESRVEIFYVKDENELVAMITNMKDNTKYFSKKCDTYEHSDLDVLVFSFQDSNVLLNVGHSSLGWRMTWKICQ
jgi:hypothetical protein